MEWRLIGSCILDSIKCSKYLFSFSVKDDHLQKYNPMSLSKKYAIMVTMTICKPFSKMSNFNSFTNLNLLCTMKIKLMLIFNEICKISWNKNFLRGWNCSFKGYISISFSVIIQINKDHIYSDLFIKSWFRRYICDVKIMHIKKSCSMDNCTPENS